ncbi:hypothetical protein F2P81_025409 [Scophthalmus maximus]|uniref:RRM domain-containing protein n=1 Tax=Scophthalmus maximus TaxID=52904 RepID=A0A6A4RUZ4_SCOMX|nr:hypothetical protein F2P81_025409 [Scophthalmus maximus]
MSLKVQTSNVTNKTDPKSLNSRVFIGNLNTAVVKKSDVESIFSKYGRVLGCSVHKGYAFVQYAGERHARGAVVGENGRVLAGQTLDINMAGDPRPNRAKGLKRSAASLYSGYEFDYDFYREDFYDRLFEFRGRVSPVPRVVPVKRPRVAVPLVRRVKSLPVKLLARNASVLPTSNGNPQKSAVRGTELQAIKSELTQIKANIEALLGRLEQITEDTRITATELRAADECKSEEAWQESGSEPEDEEQQRQNSEDGEEEEEQEEDEEEEEEGEHTQDDARDHMGFPRDGSPVCLSEHCPLDDISFSVMGKKPKTFFIVRLIHFCCVSGRKLSPVVRDELHPPVRGHSGRSADGGASVAFHFPYSVNLIPILRLQPTVRKHACKVVRTDGGRDKQKERERESEVD